MKLFINGLSPQQIKDIEQQMRPKMLSHVGFLNHEEMLVNIIEKDYNELKNHNISYTQIADKLEAIIEKAMRCIDLNFQGRLYLNRNKEERFDGTAKEGILVEDKFLVRIHDFRGSQECPFQISGKPCKELEKYGYMDCEIRNIHNQKVVFFPGLLVHLVRFHQFFEGSTKYRVTPIELLDVLELEPNISYKPTYKTELEWRNTSFQGGLKGMYDLFKAGAFTDYKDVYESPDTIISPRIEVKLYLKGSLCLLESKELCFLEEETFIHDVKLGSKKILPGIGPLSICEVKYVPID